MRAQHIGRHFDIDRAGLAIVAHGARHGLVELANHLLRNARGARGARDRTKNVDVRNVLQRSHIGLRARRAAADQQDRHAGERRIGHRGDCVRHARSGGHHGHAELPGQLGMGVRHMDRGAFVAHVDDADALPRDVIPDRLDMPALQPEDPVDAARLEKAGNPRRAGLLSAFRSSCVWILRGLSHDLTSAPARLPPRMLVPLALFAFAGRGAGSFRSRSAASRLRQ